MRLFYRSLRAIEKQRFSQLDKRIKFTSASDCVSEELVKLGIPEKNIRYISNGAEIERFKPVSKKKKLSLRKKHKLGKGLLFLFVGRLEYQHQPVEMIDIFASVVKEKTEARLIIVGDGSLEKETKERAKELGIVENVVFIPFINYASIHEVFQAADLFFLNSLYTGQSLAMLEGVAAGLPLVVPNITEFRRIVKDAGVGILYTAHKPETAGEEILQYLDKSNLEQEQKRQRKYAERKVSWAKISDEYLRYFSKKD
jgi:glycosyltransferase involved in cell wall biosynthesis